MRSYKQGILPDASADVSDKNRDSRVIGSLVWTPVQSVQHVDFIIHLGTDHYFFGGGDEKS